MCKSHFMIMIHSEWSLLLFTCLLWTGQPFIFEERGVAKTEKHNYAQEKKEKKFVHKKVCEKVYASLTYFWDL